MFLFPLIVGLSKVDASPRRGFRAGVCIGASSHCPLSEVRISYNTPRVGHTLGLGLLYTASWTSQIYFFKSKRTWRPFVSGSIAFAAPGLVLDPIRQSFETGIGGSSGMAFGFDWHLPRMKTLILTPRLGLDYGAYLYSSTGGYSGIYPSMSLDLSIDLD